MTDQLYLFTLPEAKPDQVQQAQLDLEPYRTQAKQAGYRTGFVHVWALKQSQETALKVYELLTIITKNAFFERRLEGLRSAMNKGGAA